MRATHLFRVGLLSGAMSIGLVGLSGCNPDRDPAIPTGAAQVTEGNDHLSYTAAHDGTVYLYDKTDGKLLYTGMMSKGQRIEVDSGQENHVLIDGKVVQTKTLMGGHDYRVFFDSGVTM
jgi:hypothetical protein